MQNIIWSINEEFQVLIEKKSSIMDVTRIAYLSKNFIPKEEEKKTLELSFKYTCYRALNLESVLNIQIAIVQRWITRDR